MKKENVTCEKTTGSVILCVSHNPPTNNTTTQTHLIPAIILTVGLAFSKRKEKERNKEQGEDRDGRDL